MTGMRATVPARLRNGRDRAMRRIRDRVARTADSVAGTAPAVERTLRDQPALVSSLAVASTFLLIGVISAVRRRRRQEESDGTR